MQIKNDMKCLLHKCMNLFDSFLIFCMFHPSKELKQVHISFDDVYESLKLTVENNCKSIFEIPFFKSLNNLHERYNAKFTLYIFEDNALDIPDVILEELEMCKNWLSVGYHAGIDGCVDVLSFQHFENRFKDRSFLASKYRLHGFRADLTLQEEMIRAGVVELFCADDKRTSYGIPYEIYSGGGAK